MYKIFVIDYNPKAGSMAQAIEEKANELEQDGYEVVSFAVMPSVKGIMLTRRKKVERKMV